MTRVPSARSWFSHKTGTVFLLGVCTATSARAGINPFTSEAVTRGVVYVMDNSNLYGAGCALADLDGDGDQDIVIAGAEDGHVGLFENNGTGHFTDRSAGSGIPLLSEASGMSLADYDGDGDLDLYLTQGTGGNPLPNVLGRNNGDFEFTSMAAAAGVADGSGLGQGSAFGDYDGDGWLDLYVCNYGSANKLYRNQGNGTFADASAAQGVDDPGFGYQAVWFDYDLDGDVDLYLSNDRGHLQFLGCRGNQLWRNDGGPLVNISVESGMDKGLFSMGVACGDFDGNGWPDVYCTNISNTPPTMTCAGPGLPDEVGGVFPLFLNQGNGTFMESAVAAGVDLLSEPNETGWGAIFFDYDNDTYLDLYVNLQFAPNRFFECNGTFPCGETASTLGVTGSAGPSFGSAVGDADGDGDQDLLINNLGGNVQLFINQEGEQHNWIRTRMAGLFPNLRAVGGRTNTRVGSQWQLREILAGGNSYLGQNELTMHVGLGSATQADEVAASWPGGQVTRTLTSLPANRTWTLYPPSRLGDDDGDGDSELDDFVVLAGCYQMAFEPGCEIMDFDGDSDVDADDFDDFLATFDDVPADCNNNSQPDMQDILDNPAADANANGLLDACENCANAADCGDADRNGVRDDACLWYDCAAGACQTVARTTQADLGGATGACPIDGVGDANDRFHGLNCFSNVTTIGAPGYPCEDAPPAAVNVDAGGPATCALDGVCDANEAFHALNNFSNVNFIGQTGYPCVCSGPGPAGTPTGSGPTVGPATKGRQPVEPEHWAGLILQAPARVRPGDQFDVEVFLADALPALRGYQLHLGVRGGTSGTLQLVDISMREQSIFSAVSDVHGFAGTLDRDSVLSTRHSALLSALWSAFNISSHQMLAGIDALEGLPAASGAYLATFTYQASPDAAGTFAIEVQHGSRGEDPARARSCSATPPGPSGSRP